MGDSPSRSTAGTGSGGGPAGSSAPDRPVDAPPAAVESTHTPLPGGPGAAPRPGPGGGTTLPRRAAFGMETAFRGLTLAAGSMVLVIILAIAVFLISKAVPALRDNNDNFLTSREWSPNAPEPRFGVAATAFGTLYSAVIALVLAVPVALGIALYLSHYAPRRLATMLGFLIDLLAAVPSVVFGLWGRDYLFEPIRDLSSWLHKWFGWLPLFAGDGPYGRSFLLGGVVLAIMILPIVISLSREVFSQTPKMNEEAALALGATRWEMIRTAVLPYGRPGIIAAVMLGLGRALGETIALAMTLGNTDIISFNLVENGGSTIASNIANAFGEANDVGRGALIASGLVLFAITLVVNIAARIVVYRRREFTEAAA